MSLLRRSDDHRRVLRARRRTPRPAVAHSRAQGRDAMTPASTSSQLPSAGKPHLRHCTAVALASPKVRATLAVMPKLPRRPRPERETRHRDCRSAGHRATQRAPTQAAVPPNPHRRQAARWPPRVPSWGAFGRRPSASADSSRPAGIRNPSPKRTRRPIWRRLPGIPRVIKTRFNRTSPRAPGLVSSRLYDGYSRWLGAAQ